MPPQQLGEGALLTVAAKLLEELLVGRACGGLTSGDPAEVRNNGVESGRFHVGNSLMSLALRLDSKYSLLTGHDRANFFREPNETSEPVRKGVRPPEFQGV
jgi:hypothetical protein